MHTHTAPHVRPGTRGARPETRRHEPGTLSKAKHTRTREAVIEKLAAGLSRAEACLQTGIAPATFYLWLKEDENFRQDVRLAEEEALSTYDAALRRCAAKAEEDPRYLRALIHLSDRAERRRRDAERRDEVDEQRRWEAGRVERLAARPANELTRKEFFEVAEYNGKKVAAGDVGPFKSTGMAAMDKWLISLPPNNATPEQKRLIHERLAEEKAWHEANGPNSPLDPEGFRRYMDAMAAAARPFTPGRNAIADGSPSTILDYDPFAGLYTPPAIPHQAKASPPLPPARPRAHTPPPPRSATPCEGVTATMY